jgi:hypothetical protein
MKNIKKVTSSILLSLLCPFVILNAHAKIKCNSETNGTKILYCDTSAGRSVLDNGDYSKTYCRWIAVMDLQSVNTCCTWKGGVMLVKQGKVICGDGSLSTVCSIKALMKDNKKQYLRSDDSVGIPQSSFLE